MRFTVNTSFLLLVCTQIISADYLYDNSMEHQYVYFKDIDFSTTTRKTDQMPFQDYTVLIQMLHPQIMPIENKQSCHDTWKLDGKCDQSNNNADCEYDGGDCCKETCMSKCSTASCYYACGEPSFECTDPSAKCNNCMNGTCIEMGKCIEGQVSNYLNKCQASQSFMGSSITVDPVQCALDSSCKQTQRACCLTAIQNGITSGNCLDQVQTMSIYDEQTFQFKDNQQVNCQTFFKECFLQNHQYWGQCCLCSDGWQGPDCQTPICTSGCDHGTCTSPGTCLCETGYSQLTPGSTCSTIECTQGCLTGFGSCIKPDLCVCEENWIGIDCQTPTFSCGTGSLSGSPSGQVCSNCASPFTGNFCDILNVTTACTQTCTPNGRCLPSNKCQCDVGYYGDSCELQKCLMFGAFCKTCTMNSCLSCQMGFYLTAVTVGAQTVNKCVECEVIEKGCLQCDAATCFECQYPYIVMGGTCQLQGMITLGTVLYTALDTSPSITIPVESHFLKSSTATNIKIGYSLIDNTATSSLNFDAITGIQTLTTNATLGQITADIFAEVTDTVKTFDIRLAIPDGGAMLGMEKTCVIEIVPGHRYKLSSVTWTRDVSSGTTCVHSATPVLSDHIASIMTNSGQSLGTNNILIQTSFSGKVLQSTTMTEGSTDVFTATQQLTGLASGTYDVQLCQLTPGTFVSYDGGSTGRIEIITGISYSSVDHLKTADTLIYEGFFTLNQVNAAFSLGLKLSEETTFDILIDGVALSFPEGTQKTICMNEVGSNACCTTQILSNSLNLGASINTPNTLHHYKITFVNLGPLCVEVNFQETIGLQACLGMQPASTIVKP